MRTRGLGRGVTGPETLPAGDGIAHEGEPLPDDMAAALASTPPARHFIVRLIYASELPSTNDLAVALARQGAAEGTVVAAGQQTAGRGRHGRSWFSPAGAGLYVSVIFREEALSLLSLMMGVALAESLRASTGLGVELKWPNDLVMRDRGRVRKLGGILAEASGSAASIEFVVVGFGLNVRPAAGIPHEIARRATSIEEELGKPVDRGVVFGQAIASIAEWRHALLRGAAPDLLDEWRRLAPSHCGAPVEVELADGWTRAQTAGIDVTGALLVRVNGQVERLVAGEVRWLDL